MVTSQLLSTLQDFKISPISLHNFKPLPTGSLCRGPVGSHLGQAAEETGFPQSGRTCRWKCGV